MTTELKRSDFSKICRTCLLQKDNMEPIYKSDIPKMLLSFTNIKELDVEVLPNLICSDCLLQVFNCYNFKLQCDSNESKLLAVVEEMETAPADPILTSYPSESVLKQMLLRGSESETGGVSDDDDDDDDDFFPDVDAGIQMDLVEFKPSKKVTVSDSEHVCNQCGKMFSRKDYLSKHLKRHNRKEVYTCNICQTLYKNAYSLKRHTMDIHSGEPRQKQNCPICGKTVINVKFHVKNIHSTHRPFKCAECELSFPLNCSLDRHVRFHHRGEKQRKIERLCTLCGKRFFTSTSLKYHMRRHAGENPYLCDVCSKRFNTAETLKVHRRTHTGERPYRCSHCDKAFVTNNVLKRHIRTHTGEKPYVCTICAKPFTQSIHLKTHMKTHWK